MTSNTPHQNNGWLDRLRRGLSRSSSRISDGIGAVLPHGRKLDDEALEELEELLITADIGPGLAARYIGELAKSRFGQEITPDEVRAFLADKVAETLKDAVKPIASAVPVKPFIILMVGVNGTGKTTTIGKFAKQLRDAGRSVMMAAGDTFRAAATEQLKIWGERSDCPVVARETGFDSAALAYEAVERAKREQVDILMIDTAGRLHNKAHLMEELEKIVRVIRKLSPDAPHATILTLDASTGQNAHAQVEVFRKTVNVTGLVVTKLDGSAKGGVLVSLVEQFGLPVHAIGVGENIDDLRPFEARAFGRALMGIQEAGGRRQGSEVGNRESGI